jgi:hypothetical protein
MVAFHGRQLRRLPGHDHPGDRVAARDLKRDDHGGDGQRDAEAPPVGGHPVEHDRLREARSART